MTNPKWEIGPVNLTGGHEAIIDAINKDQEDHRYTGRVRSILGHMVPTGWHANGRYMYADTDHDYNLAPPPKKTVRVQVWLNVDACGVAGLFLNREDADMLSSVNRIACIEIDREVPKGEGL